MSAKINVGILGATGAVGQRFIALLENHPWFRVAEVAASERNAGKTYAEAVTWILDGQPPAAVAELPVKQLDDRLTSPIIFSALPAQAAREVELRYATGGHVVCSNASAHRMMHDVPLLLPEVNHEHIRLIEHQRAARGWKKGALVTNSNCTVMPVVMALAPLLQFQPTHLHVVSMQAVSGAGYPGVASLDILDNVIPYIAGEEEKVAIEASKMLGVLTADGTSIQALPLQASASCNRVPVVDAHLVSVAVRLAAKPSLGDIEEAWETYQSPEAVESLPSAPAQPVIYMRQPDRPQPRRDRNAGQGMSTVVGRLRECPSIEGVQFVALSHNTIRGAAGCSILNAELLAAAGYIHKIDMAVLNGGVRTR